MQHTRLLLLSSLLLALVGCDSDPTPADAGMDDGGTSTEDATMPPPDANGHDSGMMMGGACDAPRAVTLTDGEQTITGDTSGGTTGFPLSEGCGAPEHAAPAEILALTVPGTGLKGVSFNTLNEATGWDTLLEVRPTACDSTEAATCFDDALPGLIAQSAGSFTAEGGSTVHLVVTGYGEATDSGAYELTVEVSDASAPTLTEGDAYRVGTERYDLVVRGMDAEGDVSYVRVSFLDGSGAAIEVDTDGDPETPAQSTFEVGVERVSGTPAYEALVRIADEDFMTATAAATQVEVTVVDRFDLESSSMTFALSDVTESGLGESCGASTICADGLSCDGGTCAIPADVMAACSGATAVSITPGPTTVTESVAGAVPAADSLFFESTCVPTADTSGGETLFTVDVPAGTYDLIASTENAATSEDIDTVVYFRSTCGDPGSEAACNDDDETYRSTTVLQDAPAGTYTIAVEIYGGAEAETPFSLDVSLRPVLPAGAPCDPMEAMNRCSTGTCMGDPGICPAP